MDRIVGSGLLVFVLCCAVGRAEVPPEAREANRQRVQDVYRERCELHAGNTNMLVRQGLLADREARRVVVQGEATGLAPDSTVEFFLVAENSGHDYEALAISFARPSAIHEALEFIGVAPGQPVDGEVPRVWPKGERVRMFFSPASPEGAGGLLPVEMLVVDSRTGETLPELGLVFVGSRRSGRPGADGSSAYAADVSDPQSIASNYNEPTTVLDVPRRAPQADVYAKHTVRPDQAFAPGSLLDIILVPELAAGKTRVLDLVLEAAAAPAPEASPGASTSALARVSLRLTSADGVPIGEEGGFDVLRGTLSELSRGGQDPFVTIRFADAMSVGLVHVLCVGLAASEIECGARLEPPEAGELYYGAFLPDPAFRDRERRVAQPWELHLVHGDGGATGTLVQIEQVWKDDQVWPDLDIKEYPAPTPEALRQRLDELGPGLPVILVYCPPSIRYGEVKAFLSPVLPTYSTVYVLLEAEVGSGTLRDPDGQ